MAEKSLVRTAEPVAGRPMRPTDHGPREAPKMQVVTKGWWTLREGRETAETLAKNESRK
ncbi:MAG TPA: hypothetical protein VGM87_00445 [Roseomonas sp.]